jgi:hypothetical protein
VNFPVKFPVSRETLWRLVRQGLCRQPTSAVSVAHVSEPSESARYFRNLAGPPTGSLSRIGFRRRRRPGRIRPAVSALDFSISDF